MEALLTGRALCINGCSTGTLEGVQLMVQQLLQLMHFDIFER